MPHENDVLRRLAARVLDRRGLVLVSKQRGPKEVGMEEELLQVYAACRSYTLLSLERVNAIYKGLDYVCRRGLRGAYVECGVWRGGSAMAAALSLLSFHESSRDLFLYDTFEGMPPPESNDVPYRAKPAWDLWDRESKEGGLAVDVDTVRRNLLSTAYPEKKLHFIKGPVEETIPRTVPKEIALLHLDTDFYASTKHELEHLYPRLVAGGVLIIDDYGHWKGAKKAVDEFFAERAPVLLTRVDYTGRVAVKT